LHEVAREDAACEENEEGLAARNPLLHARLCRSVHLVVPNLPNSNPPLYWLTQTYILGVNNLFYTL
jgi:hypothetical protein